MPNETAATPDMTGAARAFGNWYAACDNVDTCALYGFSREPTQGYGIVYREPGPEGDLVLTLKTRNAVSGDAVAVAVDGRELARLPVVGDLDGIVSVESGDASLLDPLLAAIADGDALSFATTVIPLDGAAAAMLWVDERQGVVGSERALRARGDTPMRELPAPPALPVARAAPAVTQDDLPTSLPDALARRDDVRACHAEAPEAADAPFVARLGDDRLLWGVVCISGAYNRGFRLFVVDGAGGAVREATLPGEDGNLVFNPAFAAGDMILSGFYKGRGIGDCGTAATWTWNGRAFDPVRRSEMVSCEGVLRNDWPLLYQARLLRIR